MASPRPAPAAEPTNVVEPVTTAAAQAPPPAEGAPLPRKKPAPPPARKAKPAALAAAPQAPIKGPLQTMTAAEDRACLAALKQAGVDFRPRGEIAEGKCGAETPLEISAVGGIKFSTNATMRCDAARATATWLNSVVVPAAARHMRSAVTSVRVAASYHCRTRRGNGRSNRLSEHAVANAIDISAVTFASGETVPVSLRRGNSPERKFQAEIRKGACPIFTTVIGPGTNAAHADHLHLDRAYRRGGYRMCR
ncbi:extensin family protein [Acuticoccus sp. MNP-M23]|uniref:extensin-like domain-containing protein n=1 Tax=Acuticoccus sp. MNP-M23 TaxID=3072793 RepID=UPI00281688FC|nr:extensin family protein [Acuticoccus sp. MNP-M23]WMS42539.1 extensin family protein [Acuticoccus sp. MNP-M23]